MTEEEDYDHEEIANAVLHGAGLGMSLTALAVLIVVAQLYGGRRHIVASSIYGSTLVILYLASTLYHSFPRGKAKYILKIIDHSAIYLLIAGTYTPITILFLRNRTGWTIFIIIWILALAGIIINVFWFNRLEKVSFFLYLVMGWLSIFVLRSLLVALGTTSLIFLALGGLFYTVGVLFYVKKDLKYNHAIWHIFVLGGSISHYFTILLSLLN
ncbi:PAQR family membrane homeostasis protein TrhA [Halarsenatibacter silvermanii]|uniref:Hemolysin III n=1 Tax=Halarsenatibacter silvermanii TaxID=321763 RepID=A0A1G9IYW2_9FIRM|nr:hemolysin III family protein [Halarsenatibacter silvermanii]SDL30281.1 hemolysin III [Halarsenatibacter silvermanii]